MVHEVTSKTKKRNKMDYDGRFIMQKTVDWSLLNDGMTIPVSACALLKAWEESIISPRSNYVRLLPTGRKNFHRIIHKNRSSLLACYQRDARIRTSTAISSNSSSRMVRY
jgi:hypothetical protein